MKRLYSLIAIACISLTAMPQAHGRFARLRQVASTMASRFKTASFNAFHKFNAQPKAVKYFFAGLSASPFVIYKQYQTQKDLMCQLNEQKKRADDNEELNKLLNMRAKLQPLAYAESRENREQQFRHEQAQKKFEFELAARKADAFSSCLRESHTTRGECARIFNIYA